MRRRSSILASTILALTIGPIVAAPAAAAEIRFRDASKVWGLEFRHRHGGSGQRYMVETMVGGVVIFDYDSDGDADVFFVDGGALPGYEGEPPRSRLFRNDATAEGPRFVDVTESSRIEVASYGAGGTAGDVDSDGDLDLYVTAFGANRLLSNNGDGTFSDTTDRAGVGDERWSMGAAFADADLDGDLDLYVTNYVSFTLENHRFCGVESQNIRSYCHPDVYEGVQDRFYRNRGDGTFDDATEAAGFLGAAGKGLGVGFGDLTNDGYPDLYVANDTTPNFVFLNRGDGTFEDVSLLSGATHSDRGRPEAGMGVEFADVDRDGFFDVVVTNFELETNVLYQNLGEGLFSDVRFPTGIAEPSLLRLAFGVALADFDLDSDQDMAVANGHINDNAEILGSQTPYKQPNQAFEYDGRRFRELPSSGIEEAVRSSRGLAVGDLDLDGDPDVVIVNSNDLAEVYENATETAGGWITVERFGSSVSLQGVGTRVELAISKGTASKGTTYREIRTGSSYLSQNELRVHFGTGTLEQIERLVIRPPAGGVREWRRVPVRRRLVVP